jgi:hypothetical protein
MCDSTFTLDARMPETARAKGRGARRALEGGMRTTCWVSSFVLLGACLAACVGQTSGTGPGAGTGSVSGTVAGTTFQAASVVASVQSETANSTCSFGPDGGQSCVTTSSGQVVVVALTNRADATCGYIQSQAASGTDTTFANFDVLVLAVGTPNGDVTPGTYNVGAMGSIGPTSTQTAFAQLETTTATCVSGNAIPATGGTITLTQAGPGAVAGSYEVTFGTQGSFSGSFDVETCAIPDAGARSFDAGAPVCKP